MEGIVVFVWKAKSNIRSILFVKNFLKNSLTGLDYSVILEGWELSNCRKIPKKWKNVVKNSKKWKILAERKNMVKIGRKW